MPAVFDVSAKTDLLIVGGANAGCFTAVATKAVNPSLRIMIMEKALFGRLPTPSSLSPYLAIPLNYKDETAISCLRDWL